MADEDVLSQEEIDALLESVDEDAPEQQKEDGSGNDASEEGSFDENASNEEKSTGEISLVTFTNQERNVRGELPVLEKIHDRICNFFKQELYQLMSKEFEFKQSSLAVYKHKDFMGKLVNPTFLRLFQFKPLRGKSLIYFDSIFVYDLVNVYFGGGTQFASNMERTDFTATEMRIMDIVIDKLRRNIEQAWRPILPMNVVELGGESNPMMVHVAEPTDVVLVTRFELNFGQEKGHFGIVVPYTMVEPIKQQLELGAARPDSELDPNWVKSLKEEIMEVELEISAYMAKGKSSLGEVMTWKKGDWIPLQQCDTITLDVESTPAYEVSMGSSGDKLALQILKQINY